ncbi:MAG: hypothetical protein VX589_09430 [Myxococcota bacterium]|nr:hypothetical protein [Myxococcota bacterium]
MSQWRTFGLILVCWGCGEDTHPTRPLPVDTYDGSLFDARRPFDPVTSANRSGYGSTTGSGTGSGYGASGVPPLSETERVDADMPSESDALIDSGLDTLDGGVPDAGPGQADAMTDGDDLAIDAR